MLEKSILASAIAVAMTVSASAAAEKKGSFEFKPLDESANAADFDPAAPWKLPRGFTQTVVSDESDLNIYQAPNYTFTDRTVDPPELQSNDWHDMNTVNETGPMAGRFMYRTHEVRNNPEGGAVSVVDLKTGETRVLVQDVTYNALDGIRWTPWGSIVFAEEVTGGRFLEIVLDENDLMTAVEVIDHPAVGRLAHEGIDFDADGNVYVVDEHRGRTSGCNDVVPCGGGVYKFVPNYPGDLSAGELFALKVTGKDGVGQGEWVGPIDPLNARESGTEFGGQSYQRPEDVEVIGDTLYVAITEGPRDVATETDPAEPNFGQLEFKSELYEGRVIAVNLKTMEVTNFVKPDVNVPVEIGRPGDAGHQSGFDSVDNLAEAPNGDLVMIEDNVPSDIWFASTRTNEFGASLDVDLFASLTDPAAEGTGIYFSPLDPKTLYVNVQHSSVDDGDATWAITRKGRGHRKGWGREDD